MTAFIEGMGKTFEKYLTKREVKTPIPAGFFTFKKQTSNLDECKEILDRGYQRLFGMLLWSSRGVMVDCLPGISMLGRVVATPAEEDWKAAIHMMNYQYQNRSRGIKFSSNGNPIPVGWVDASNKPDPSDSKCQYGYVIKWKGGPIITISRKLAHVGLSAAHNEYMAIHWCLRHVRWLRDLLREIGLLDAVVSPTVVFGDNRAANLLCEEDIVTTGNQHIIVPYHYNKEVVRMREAIIRWIATDDNIADLMSKGVSRQVIERLLMALLGYF